MIIINLINDNNNDLINDNNNIVNPNKINNLISDNNDLINDDKYNNVISYNYKSDNYMKLIGLEILVPHAI